MKTRLFLLLALAMISVSIAFASITSVGVRDETIRQDQQSAPGTAGGHEIDQLR
jgi:hypothetical protein